MSAVGESPRRDGRGPRDSPIMIQDCGYLRALHCSGRYCHSCVARALLLCAHTRYVMTPRCKP